MAKEEKKEDTLVVVGEGADPTPEPEETEEKKPVAKTEDDADQGDEGGDERIGQAEAEDGDEGPAGETQDAKRDRRRVERKNRKERERREKRELSFLRQRNADLEQRFSNVELRLNANEVVSIDQRIGQTEHNIKIAEGVHAKAVAAGDGETATEALKIKDELNDRLKGLKGAKEEKAKPVEKRPEGPDPELLSRAAAWVERNEWFDTSLTDTTSYLVKSMEERLGKEGRLDPRTDEYWEELDRRVQKQFPSLKKAKPVRDDLDEHDEEEASKPVQKKNNGGPKFSVGGRERPLKKNEVYIDAERRKALEDAGLWDDEATRNRYLKSYKTYDDNATNTK